MTLILGISAYYHDSAVCLIKNGEIIYAAQEERFSRIKHDSSFPKKSLHNLLKYCSIKISDLSAIVFYDKPFLKFERLIETYLSFCPKGFKQYLKAIPIWVNDKLFLKKMLIEEIKLFDKKFNGKNLFFSEHHLSHAASAFYPSPFEKAIILTADGVGEWTTTSISIGYKNKIKIEKEIFFPHSIGLLYSAFTYFLGFKVNSGEYKVMGLAPYGKDRFKKIIKEKLINIKDDGSFHLNQNFFEYATGFQMTNNKFEKLFGIKKRLPETAIKQIHKDIAASIQSVTEEVMLKICLSLKKTYNLENLCLAGGVALNCVVNGKILSKKIFKNVWVQPAAGDAGGAMGAAFAYYYIEKKNSRKIHKNDQMKDALLGPKFSPSNILQTLNKNKILFQKLSENNLIKVVAFELSKGKAVGWFQDKMEFGPRALGSRSIIADPRKKKMQKLLNLKIKFRESFRPFAPSVLYEDAKKWFDLKVESPYMLIVANLKKKGKAVSKLEKTVSKIPAVTHVDYSARIQTVKNKKLKYYKLLKEFKKITGVPILVNTSFNIRGEPIVCSPQDAINCFLGTDLDLLVLENFIIYKKEQDKSLIHDYKNSYQLD